MSLIYPKSIFILLPSGKIINTSHIRQITSCGLVDDKETYCIVWSYGNSIFPLSKEDYDFIRGEFLNLSVMSEVIDG